MPCDAAADWTRRDFLRGGSVAALMAMAGGVELRAEAEVVPTAAGAGPEFRCAVIGMGPWGRELLSTLGRLPGVKVAAICDVYPASLRRAKVLAPEAALVEDYRSILGQKEISGVIVSTPSHLHTEVAVAALQAGKHVYCEAPLATRMEEARAIALAAKRAAPGQVFQAGLQARSSPQRLLASGFFKAGTSGRPVLARSHWSKKVSWRQAAAAPDRAKDVNWRLDRATSLGLAGEIGIHHFDAATWFFGERPVAVSGVGSLRHWREDGRTTPDTVQVMLEFPEGLRLVESLTLGSSFEGDQEVYQGTDSAIVFRGDRAWMFKEADAPLLGWEVHAKTETFREETGIVLVANASKQKAAPEGGEGQAVPVLTPLHHALESFVRSAQEVEAARADFVTAYGADDVQALKEHLATVARRPGAGYQEGFEAAVVAIQASEAVLAGRRIEFKPEWFELG